MVLADGFTFWNFLIDVAVVFLFMLWFWLLIVVAGDLFRRRDISGFAKVIWIILLIVVPYLGIFLYLLTQSRSMANREAERAKDVQAHLREIVGYSIADEIEKLGRLKADGSITAAEYDKLRKQLVG